MNTAISTLAQSGGRDTLIQDFRAVAEATTLSGAPRYSETPTLMWLAKFVTGAAGGPNKDAPLFELCHLITALKLGFGGGADLRAEFFLGLNPATPAAYKSFFDDAVAGEGLTVEDEQVTLNSGPAPFSIRYGRMPRLVALFEFLAGLDAFSFFGAFNDILDELEQSPNLAAIKAAANQLSSRMRHYRLQHLASAESDGKFTTVYSFLQDRSPQNAFQIDDAAIFEFWALHNQQNDYKGYRTVFDLFFKFMAAMDEVTSRRAAQDAGVLGADREGGELDIGEDSIDVLSPNWESPLDVFEEPPLSDIKFFKKSTELKPLETLMTYGPKVQSLALAFLRYEIFGFLQSAITNDLQIGRGEESVQNRVQCTDAEAYTERKTTFETLEAHVHQLIQACLHVVASDTVVAFPGIEDDSAKAFKKLTRKGFDDRARDNADAFKLAADPLLSVRTQLQGLLKALDKLDLETHFDADRVAFRQQFRALYGEAS
ncbi:hypothetical protein V5T82_14630 [Magnetovibrio sp. PR-2]|uniref:hypothetical protein n=1 Tax=Magnetovibrio sp. PR-2 TaxID=3120356 RepID=UPI002FCE4CD7